LPDGVHRSWLDIATASIRHRLFEPGFPAIPSLKPQPTRVIIQRGGCTLSKSADGARLVDVPKLLPVAEFFCIAFAIQSGLIAAQLGSGRVASFSSARRNSFFNQKRADAWKGAIVLARLWTRWR